MLITNVSRPSCLPHVKNVGLKYYKFWKETESHCSEAYAFSIEYIYHDDDEDVDDYSYENNNIVVLSPSSPSPSSLRDTFLLRKAAERNILQGAKQSMKWVGSIHGLDWSGLNRKITSFVGWVWVNLRVERFLCKLMARRVRFLLLITFCQHLIVSPVIDTKHILYSFNMSLLLNSLLNYCRV